LNQRLSKLRTQTSAKKLSSDLKAFVHGAWPILEPITRLSWNWHLDLICEYLTLIKDNHFREVCGAEMEGIIFNVPPRTMKSLLITVFFPVWVWTSDPARRWMFSSYAEKLSTQHSLYRRNVIESAWYQQRWNNMFSLAKDLNLKTHYENSARGSMFSTAMQASATGLGGDVLVFDDPMNPDQALSETERQSINDRFDQTFRSRLNDPATGVKIIVMQRLHEEDLTGHVLGKERDCWVHVKLPAIAERSESIKFPVSGRTVQRHAKQLLWPGRLPEPQLANLKTGLGSWAFAGQYQQNPAPLEGGIIKRNWIRFYRELPERFDLLVQSWDCTFKGESTARGVDTDFVAGQVWGKSGGRYFMLPYRMHERLDFGPTKSAIKACHAAYPRAHAILIEDKANGPAIISELQQVIPGIIAVDPEGGKVARAHSISPLWEAGSIVLPDPQVFDGRDAAHPQANWVEEYIHNICTFPQAAHDDDMDATSQALIYMRHKMGGGILDFYRGHAELQIVSNNVARGLPPKKGARVPETRLTQSIKDAVNNIGGTILCSRNQYPEVRQALLDVGSESALAEVKRMDAVMGWGTG
jgi:predicted phage terminase large subunit-like protein